MNLRDSIHNDLLTGQYECVICLNNVNSKSPLWNCHSCFRVFDLKCIKDWANRNLLTKESWNCPFCQTVQHQTPANIRNKCWCGKGKPRPVVKQSQGSENEKNHLIPHSCGSKCKAKRSCPHPCPLICHAGPHEDVKECTISGPRISCYCGKHHETKPCNETQYNGYSCEERCSKVDKICGHKCTRICHKQKRTPRNRNGGGALQTCGPCKAQVRVSCFCGKIDKKLRNCSSLRTSERKKLHGRTFIGDGEDQDNNNHLSISCQKPCNQLLSCGKHRCTRTCHKLDDVSHKCPFIPYESETCFCGSSPARRTSCEDPVPSCGSVCFKTLPCGHKCRKSCHPGECPPCIELIHGLVCRCKESIVSATCAQVKSGQITCDKKCNAHLSCHRHQCRKTCCEFSPKPKSKSSRRANQANISISDLISGVNLDEITGTNDSESRAEIEAEEAAHLCTETCGRPLSCGAHFCEKACHSGKCPPCGEVSFDLWTCNCGKTAIHPPIRCGTPMPTCRHPCVRERPCGHAPGHLCHDDGVSCPPCKHIIEFPCKCGKSTVKIPCSEVGSAAQKIANFNCLTPCEKLLPCGHMCQQKCCDSNSECPPCNAPCDIPNSVCGHPHRARCHYPDPCPQACGAVLVAKCHCSVLKSSYECGEDLEIGCNERCIDEHYSPSLLLAFEQDPAWMMNIEIQLRAFVRNSDRKTLRFKPMSAKNRKRIYELLEHYRLSGQSLDEGENRSVCVYLTEDRWIPQYTLKNAPRKDPYVGIDESALHAPLQYVKWKPTSDEVPNIENDSAPKPENVEDFELVSVSPNDNTLQQDSNDGSYLPTITSEDGFEIVTMKAPNTQQSEQPKQSELDLLLKSKPSFSVFDTMSETP